VTFDIHYSVSHCDNYNTKGTALFASHDRSSVKQACVPT